MPLPVFMQFSLTEAGAPVRLPRCSLDTQPLLWLPEPWGLRSGSAGCASFGITSAAGSLEEPPGPLLCDVGGLSLVRTDSLETTRKVLICSHRGSDT